MFVFKVCNLIRQRKLLVEEERRLNRVSQDPIEVAAFVKEHRRRTRNKELQYEFKAIEQISVGDKQSASIRSEGQHKVSEAARLQCNKEKNLTDRVLPYERNIVRLDPGRHEPEGDGYINASWIDGYNQPKRFIAAQGPLAATKNDFWRMVWQYHSDCIVMTTNLFEHARQQCDKYWHNVYARFDDIEVWLDDLYSTAEYENRLFKIKRAGCETRLVRQFQFKNWSHFDTPLPTTVIEIRRKVNDWVRGKSAPIIVHCSDGAGRTGTYICIDIEICKAEEGRSIDILQQTLALRKARPGLVGNLSQYRFVYETLATAVACRPTTIKVFDFAKLVARMSQPADGAGSPGATGFAAEFACLASLVKPLSVGECAGGHRAENRWKSRDVMVQPPERARPYLLTQDSASSTDFINAVYVDGHSRANQYIVTQWPLKNTICDFWKLIHDHHVSVVVVLSDFSRGGAGSLPRFWPADKGSEQGYGSVFAIKQDEFKVTESVLCRIHAVTKIGSGGPSGFSQDVRHVAFLCLASPWPTAGSRKNGGGHGLLELACLAESTNQSLEETPGSSPLLVVNSDGVSRCGVFCALHMIMDKMRYEGEVDIFRAVEKVKRNRPQLVGNLTEYEQCFALAQLLIEYFFSGRVCIQDSQSLRLQDLDQAPPVSGRPASIADFRFPTAHADTGGVGRRTLDALLLPCARRRRRQRQLRLAAAIV